MPTGINGMLWTSSDGTFTGTSSAGANALLANYRVVGSGAKLRSCLATTHVQPRVSVYTLPCVHNGLAWTNVVNNNVFTAPLAATGVGGAQESWIEQTIFGVAVAPGSNFLASPNSRDFTLYDILNDEAVITFKPTSPAAFEFNDLVGSSGVAYNSFVNRSGDTVAATDVSDYVVSGAPVVSAVGESGDCQCDGWTGAFVDVRAPTLSAGNVYMVVDQIYHLEGIPKATNVNGSGVQTYKGRGFSVEEALATSRKIVDIVLPRLPTAIEQLGNVMTAMGLTTNANRRYRPMLSNGEL